MELTLSPRTEARVLRRVQEAAKALGKPVPKKVSGKAIQEFARLLPNLVVFVNRSMFTSRLGEFDLAPGMEVSYEDLRNTHLKSFSCRFNNDIDLALIKVL